MALQTSIFRTECGKLRRPTPQPYCLADPAAQLAPSQFAYKPDRLSQMLLPQLSADCAIRVRRAADRDVIILRPLPHPFE